MREILPDIARWRERGERVALATVVRAYGSAPRKAGSKMAVSESGEMSGSVSGGCVEADVVLHSRQILESGAPRLIEYGISDEFALDVGLACGGSIEVFVEPLKPSPLHAALEACIAEETGAVLLTIIGGRGTLAAKLLVREDGSTQGSLGAPALDAAAIGEALLHLRRGESGVIRCPAGSGDEAEVFVDAYPPPPTLLIFGGNHVAVELTRLAKALSFRVEVVDARGRFATRERFPDADSITVAWADDYLGARGLRPNTYVAVLTHDPKLDDPALVGALRAGARYVGAIGSRSTHAGRLERLERQGLTREQLAHIHSPIGLDLGARDPAEIALSVLAEIVAVKNNAGIAAPTAERQPQPLV